MLGIVNGKLKLLIMKCAESKVRFGDMFIYWKPHARIVFTVYYDLKEATNNGIE